MRILQLYPERAVAQLPLPRWRKHAEDLRAKLRINTDVPGLVAEWRERLLNNSVRNGQTEIERRDTGQRLTEAVQRYAQSFEWPESERPAAYTVAYTWLFPLRSRDPIVQILIEAFRRLLLYRMGRIAEISDLNTELPGCFQRLQATLEALRGHRCDPECLSGLGLREISPVPADAELEKQLERAREKPAQSEDECVC